jgi:hypothetical protein
MTSQAVMKRYINALAKKNQSNPELQKLSTAINNFKKLTKEQQGKVNRAVETAYEKLQAKGVSAKKVVSKPTSTPKAKSSSTGGLKPIISQLKNQLGASSFKAATTNTNIAKDIKLPALKKGKRIVRNAGKTTNQYGTFENKVGSTYYENRANRYDANQPSTTRKYKLADGGSLGEVKVGDYFINTTNGEKFYIEKIDKKDKSYPFYVIKSKPTDLPEVISFDEWYRYSKNGLFEKVDGKFADGGMPNHKVNLSFQYNPGNLSNEEAERIVSKYTKDWKHDNDLDDVSFYVFGLTRAEAVELRRELKMEDTYNIEMDNSQYAKGGELNSISKIMMKQPYSSEFEEIAKFKTSPDATTSLLALEQQAPSKKFKLERANTYAKGGEIAEGNYEMILSQAKEVQHHAKELQDILKGEKEIEAWVVAKMENVSSTLSDITHYLDGKTEYANGGKVGINSLEGWDRNNFIFAYGYAKDRQVNHKGTFEVFEKDFAKKVDENFNSKVLKAVYDELNKKNSIYKSRKYAQGGTTKRIKRKSC